MTQRYSSTGIRHSAFPILLACFVGLAALVYAWFEQYTVDAEVTLLPWLMGHGWILYNNLIDQHPPLLPLLLVPLNGDPGLPLRILILALRGLTLALTYAVGVRLAGVWGGLVALAGAALWALGTDGAHLWYDGALAPVYLGVVLLLAPRRGDPLKSDATSRPAINIRVAIALGVLLAVGLLLKQHAVLALPGVVLALAWGRHAGRAKRLAAFAAGLALPLLLVGLYYALQGAISEATYWIFAYTFDGNYAAAAGLAPAPDEWQWMAIAFAPAVALLLSGAAIGPRVAWRAYTPLILAGPWLLLATILPVWPRYGRFHLQAAVPLLAVMAGAAVVALGYAYRVHAQRVPGRPDLTRRSRALYILAALLLSVWLLGGVREGVTSFSVQTTLGPVAAPYAATAPPLAAWIDAHTAPGAPIILYGVDPLIYRSR